MLVLYSDMDASINWHDSTSMILVSMVVPDCYGAMREMGRCRSSCRINQPWIIPAQITLKCINALDGRATGQRSNRPQIGRATLASRWLAATADLGDCTPSPCTFVSLSPPALCREGHVIDVRIHSDCGRIFRIVGILWVRFIMLALLKYAIEVASKL